MIQAVELIHDRRQVSKAVGHMLGAVNPDSSLLAQRSYLRSYCVLLHQLCHRCLGIAGCFCCTCTMHMALLTQRTWHC